mgnify:CR=1 FL=1
MCSSDLLSLNGFGGAGGMGKTLAEWIVDGQTEWDVSGYRPWRFPDVYRDPKHAAVAAQETYRYYYRLRYPYDQDEWGRPTRESFLHSRLQEAGTVFGVKSGFERAEYVDPGAPWRRMGADQRAWGWGRMPFFDLVGDEHRAMRESAGLIDLSSFGKLLIEGPDALALLQFACDAEIDRPVGSVVYTQMLDHRGGVTADITVTRLADDRFRMVTGAGAVATDRGWLQGIAHRLQLDVAIRERTGVPVVVDPKRLPFAHYRGFSVATPNLAEASLAAGVKLRTDPEKGFFGTQLQVLDPDGIPIELNEPASRP